MKKVFLSLLFILCSLFSFAQEQVEMADNMRAEGKIYVVVAVLVTILLGIILFLIMIDRKVSDIEKKLNKK
jgi:bacteriorhodopsin